MQLGASPEEVSLRGQRVWEELRLFERSLRLLRERELQRVGEEVGGGVLN